MATETTKLDYLRVVITPEGVAEMDGASRVVFVPKSDIQKIELASGTGAERPLIQSLFGAVLVVVGLFSVKSIYLWMMEGGTISTLQVGLVVFMLAGAWMLWGVFRKRTYLLVTTRNDTRKIVFAGKVDPVRLSEFVQAANCNFGYLIQSCL